MRTRSLPSAAGMAGMAPAMPGSAASTAAGGLGVGLVDDDLEGAGGAVAEGVLDQVVADPGAGVLGQHLDRGHRGLQAQDRGGEREQHDERGQAPKTTGRFQSRSPQAANFGERCSPVCDPGQRELVDPVVELEQHQRQQGERGGEDEDDRRA